jgi:hypothetical protein
MTRARWITSILVLSALWLLGALVFVPRLERELAVTSRSMLSQQPLLARRLNHLQLEFDGQRAHLSGKVRTVQDRLTVETAVRDLVRAPTPLAASLGLRFNPVADIRNDIEVLPFPSGWMLLAANGPQAKLLGTAANDYEARDLSRSVQNGWSAKGGTTEGTLTTDTESHDEADNVTTTLRSMPAPPTTAQAYLARIGESWKELTLAATDETLQAEARAHGVSETDWRQRVLPVLHELRAALKQQQTTEAERQRLARLPPGHLFIATRASQVILRGEVGTAAMKRAILDEALEVFSQRRVRDEIRISSQRRPAGEFGPITTALLPSPKEKNGRAMFISLSGDAWQPVDWQIAPAEQSWNNNLPTGLDAALLRNDSAVLSTWLESANNDPSGPQPLPAFITLALFDSKVILSGQVAEESARSQIIAAVRKAYAPRVIVLHDELRLHADCKPSNGIIHTVSTLPAAVTHGLGSFAIAVPGGAWSVIPVTRDLIEAGGLARSKQLPSGLSVALVEERSAEAIEQLRLWVSNFKSHVSNP